MVTSLHQLEFETEEHINVNSVLVSARFQVSVFFLLLFPFPFPFFFIGLFKWFRENLLHFPGWKNGYITIILFSSS